MPTALETPDRRRLNNLKSGRGRRWGSRNRIPLDLKKAIIAAAEAHGDNGAGHNGLLGYCFMLAARHPRTFAMLLQKLLPLQLDADFTAGVIHQIQVVTIPAGQCLSAKDPRRMAPGLEIALEATIEPECEPEIEPEAKPIEERRTRIVRVRGDRPR